MLAGHGCIGCTMPNFWDGMGGAYQRLPAPLPFLPDVSSDTLGLALTGGVAGLAVVHGGASYVRQWRVRRSRRPIDAPKPSTEPVAEATAGPTAEATARPTAEPTTEPTAEPVAQPAEPISAVDAAFALGDVATPPDALEGRPSAGDNPEVAS